MKPRKNQTYAESIPNKARPYAIELIESALRASQTKSQFRAYGPQIPYCFKTIALGQLLPLNRGYRPLGVAQSTACVVNYNSPEYSSLRLLGSCLDRSALLSDVYLFNDSCSPLTGTKNDREIYLFRLWWALRRYGLTLQKTQIPMLERCAKVCGVNFQRALIETGIRP
jgi:hypothetical protein